MQPSIDVMPSRPLDRDRHTDMDDGPDLRQCLTVVLAEDDESLRSMLAALLRKDGYRVFEVGDGGGLLTGMACERFGGMSVCDNVLLVTDARMPNRGGLSVVRALKAAGRGPRFILMTAFGEPELHAEARRLCALAVFDKPFDFDDLRRAIRDVAYRFALHWRERDSSTGTARAHHRSVGRRERDGLVFFIGSRFDDDLGPRRVWKGLSSVEARP